MVVGTLTLISILLFGGGGPDSFLGQTLKLVKKYVEDKGRRAEAETILVRATEEVQAFEMRILEYRDQLAKVDANYRSRPEDYRLVLRQLDVVWVATHERIFDLRFELKKQVTREEWKDLFSAVQEKRAKARR